MEPYRSLDSQVRASLKKWPQRPPGVGRRNAGMDAWLRGRPGDDQTCHPFLKVPGSNRLRTLPDGLWLNFGGTPFEPFVDIFAIEACGSLQNMLDKRSRFAPSVHSLLAVCPVPWLLAPVSAEDPTPRWKATGVLLQEPAVPLVLPVRDVRVMYGLKPRHYKGFAKNHLPHPHEYYVPMDALTAENGDQDPALQALMARACTASNFLSLP
ncbi:MAG: hypothetical protein JOY71_24940 [Acetobacteraceae bacterium]|nr:hypothetical protein [Acetobacteraceae bacterium]MBV8525328.1 hypothetical protein [Acetobacteraceae bacterium]